MSWEERSSRNAPDLNACSACIECGAQKGDSHMHANGCMAAAIGVSSETSPALYPLTIYMACKMCILSKNKCSTHTASIKKPDSDESNTFEIASCAAVERHPSQCLTVGVTYYAATSVDG